MAGQHESIVEDGDGQGGSLSPRSARLVDLGDLNELTLHVNGLALDQRWDEMAALRSACRLAFERGKQLWPVSSYIEYRLCLEAPGPWAAAVVESGSSRFTLGPLSEVAASRHSWAELAPWLHQTPEAAMAAHERVVRGEDLSADLLASSLPEVLDLPFALQPWEPAYALAEYHPDHLEALSPKLPALGPVGVPEGPAPGGFVDEVCEALEELVATWTSQSDGRAVAVAVEGSALQAVNALGARRAEAARLSAKEALAAMAWAAASGGAHGRRRGAASGRFGAWCVLAALGGLAGEWPLPVQRLGEVAEQAAWFGWAGPEPPMGWTLHLAVEAPPASPYAGRAWALSAVDAT